VYKDVKIDQPGSVNLQFDPECIPKRWARSLIDSEVALVSSAWRNFSADDETDSLLKKKYGREILICQKITIFLLKFNLVSLQNADTSSETISLVKSPIGTVSLNSGSREDASFDLSALSTKPEIRIPARASESSVNSDIDGQTESNYNLRLLF
jgi:hypothetical protein